MKIGIYAHWNVNWDGGTLRLMGCHARSLRHFIELTEGVRLFTTVVPELQDTNSEMIVDSRLEIVPIPGRSFTSTWRSLPKLRRLFAEHLDGLDAMYARVFDPCTWLLAPVCEARRIGLVFDIVGNPARELLQHRDWSWVGRWARRGLFWIEELLVLRAAWCHVLLLHGGDVTRAYAHLHPAPETIFSSTVEPSEFYRRDDTCTNGEAVILYTGFLRVAKGLEDLIEAVGLLVRQGRRVRLRLVGPAQHSAYLETLQGRVRSLGLDGLIEFLGYVPLGDPLMAQYRSADLYAFPSLSEGSARTLLEAATQSLPCVITDVGSARDLFTDGQSALIVPCGDPAALARGLARFLDEPELRGRCIRNAYEIASRYTCRDSVRHLLGCLDKSHRRAQATPPRREGTSVHDHGIPQQSTYEPGPHAR